MSASTPGVGRRNQSAAAAGTWVRRCSPASSLLAWICTEAVRGKRSAEHPSGTPRGIAARNAGDPAPGGRAAGVQPGYMGASGR